MNYIKNSDSLNFNETQLENQIELLEEIRDMSIKLKNQYLDYVTNQLMPSWTTDNGIKCAQALERFANGNINEFITYFNNKISDLRDIQPELKGINLS